MTLMWLIQCDEKGSTRGSCDSKWVVQGVVTIEYGKLTALEGI